MSDSIIKIPSKNLYKKENQKVVDNIIERIEVGALDILPNNGNGVTVYNEAITTYDGQISQQDKTDPKVFSSGESMTASKKRLTVAYSNAMYIDQTVWKKKVYIPVVKDNKYINRIYNGENKSTGESIIGCSIYGHIYKYDIKSTWDILDKNNITERDFDLTRTNPEENTTTLFNFPSSIEEKPKGFNLNSKVSIGAYDNLKTATFEKETIDGIEYYVTTLEVLAKITTSQFSGSSQKDFNMSEEYTAIPVELKGKLEVYEPTRIEFSFLGDTIGIELVDKTIYVNGETQKKVHSVDGNELMQTSNYYLSNGVKMPNIEFLYESTNTLYKKGKETATIRCSISDYFDYSTNEKVISTDGTTNKMAFSLYDKVVPMVRNGQGIDVPMSLTKAGNAKSFSVLGTKIFYDGAVWQELYLQESRDDSPISKPTISIDGDILGIFSLDDRVSSFEVYIDDALNTTVQYLGKETTVDLSKFNLSSQVHKIAVKAKASGYDDSELSDAIYYGAGPKQLKAPTISLSEGKYLKIASNDWREAIYRIYIRNNYGITLEYVDYEGTETIIRLTTLKLATGENKITVTAVSAYYVDSPESNEVVYYVQPEPEVPTPDGVDNDFNNALKTELLISGVWCFADTPDIEWLNRVLRVGTNVTQFTVLASHTGDVEDIEAWGSENLAFTSGGIIIGGTVYTTFGDGARRFIWFDTEQHISYNLANWIVGNTLVLNNATSLMSTRARTTFPKGSIKYI